MFIILWLCSAFRKYVFLLTCGKPFCWISLGSVPPSECMWPFWFSIMPTIDCDPMVIIFCLLDCVYMFILLPHFMLNVLSISFFSLYVVMSHNCFNISKLCTDHLQPSSMLSKYVNVYHSWNNLCHLHLVGGWFWLKIFIWPVHHACNGICLFVASM
jgi:hypothetical protein